MFIFFNTPSPRAAGDRISSTTLLIVCETFTRWIINHDNKYPRNDNVFGKLMDLTVISGPMNTSIDR